MAVLRVAVSLALAASAALYVDYATLSPTFCGTGSGCTEVRYSGYGYLLGVVPVPLVGLLAFGGVLVIALLPASAARDRWLVLTCTLGGVGGLLLIVIQAVVIGAFCWLCMVVDASALVAASAAVAHYRQNRRAEAASPHASEPLERWSWALLGILAVVAPLLWPRVKPQPPVPAPIAQLYVPDKINVVEFADFECPFCRELHKLLKVMLRDYAGRVNLVRLHVPLAAHSHARAAARAAVCAEQQGTGEAMADALFESDELSADANRVQAEVIGLDMQLYDRCIRDPITDQRIERQTKILIDAGMQGLPTTYIGRHRIVGLQPESVFRHALNQAATRAGEGGIPAGGYWAMVLAVAGSAVYWGRRRARKGKAEPIREE